MRENTSSLCYNSFKEGCLSATFLKVFAVVSMTIDHLGVYGQHIGFVVGHVDEFRIIGRMAAPLFLYTVMESLKHTGNKMQYLKRLYIAAVVIGFTNLIASLCFSMLIAFGNIIQTFFWTVLISYVFELAIKQYRANEPKRCAKIVVTLLMTIIVAYLIESVLLNYSYLIRRILPVSAECIQIIQRCVGIFVFSPRRVMYYETFIVLGLFWYFSEKRSMQCAGFTCLCILSYFFQGGNQWLMVAAAPFIILYNGKYGRGCKYFFYIYYPLHCYIIAFIDSLNH